MASGKAACKTHHAIKIALSDMASMEKHSVLVKRSQGSAEWLPNTDVLFDQQIPHRLTLGAILAKPVSLAIGCQDVAQPTGPYLSLSYAR